MESENRGPEITNNEVICTLNNIICNGKFSGPDGISIYILKLITDRDLDIMMEFLNYVYKERLYLFTEKVKRKRV